MDTFTKIYTIIKVILGAAVLYGGFTFLHVIENKLGGGLSTEQVQAMLDAQNREFKQLAENIVRANTEINDKKLKEEFNKLDSKITTSIKDSNEKISQIGKIVASQKQQVALNQASNVSYKKGTGDPNAYDFEKIYEKDSNGNEYPVAWVMYYPNREEGKRWKYGTYPLDYNVKVVQTLQKSGTTNNYAEVTVENNQMKETKGKEFAVAIKDAQFVQKSPEGKEFMFAPAFDMGIIGVGGTTNNFDFGGMANVSFFGYGRTKKELDWRFLSLGVGGNDKNIWGEFSPAMYNIGNHIPLMSNLWLAPYVILDKDIRIGGGGGLSVRF
jgi:hypothetical protein